MEVKSRIISWTATKYLPVSKRIVIKKFTNA